MLTQILGGLFFAVSLLFMSPNPTEPQAADCCQSMLACCSQNQACCLATSKTACCAEGLACQVAGKTSRMGMCFVKSR